VGERLERQGMEDGLQRALELLDEVVTSES